MKNGLEDVGRMVMRRAEKTDDRFEGVRGVV
jgi:hypothetical protein